MFVDDSCNNRSDVREQILMVKGLLGNNDESFNRVDNQFDKLQKA